MNVTLESWKRKNGTYRYSLYGNGDGTIEAREFNTAEDAEQYAFENDHKIVNSFFIGWE